MLSQTNTKATILRKAILVGFAAFGLVAVLYFAGLVSQSRLFELASLSFFLSYILAVLAFLRYGTSITARLFGFATFVFVTYVFLQFGVKVIYPIAVFLLGLALSYLQKRRLLKSR